MDEYFDIYGTPIPLSTKKDFRICSWNYNLINIRKTIKNADVFLK